MWIVAALFAGGAAYMDWRFRRIPNWWTLPGLLLGLCANYVLSGWAGSKTALWGAGLILLALLPFVFLRSLGAGDWKMMVALGALLGPYKVFLVLCGATVAAGIMAVVEIVRQKRLRRTLSNMGRLLYFLFTFGWRARLPVTIDDPDSLTVPFGVATAISVVGCFVATLAVR